MFMKPKVPKQEIPQEHPQSAKEEQVPTKPESRAPHRPPPAAHTEISNRSQESAVAPEPVKTAPAPAISNLTTTFPSLSAKYNTELSDGEEMPEINDEDPDSE